MTARSDARSCVHVMMCPVMAGTSSDPITFPTSFRISFGISFGTCHDAAQARIHEDPGSLEEVSRGRGAQQFITACGETATLSSACQETGLEEIGLDHILQRR